MLENLNHYTTWRPAGVGELDRLSGQYYYLDLEYQRHFGHSMTEAVPRLYGWHDAKKENADLKIIMTSPTASGELLLYQSELLRAYGIDVETEVLALHGAVQVESLLSPMQLSQNMKYAHSVLRGIFERIGNALHDCDGPVYEKVFISRRAGMWRECLNQKKLETVFVEDGFEAVYPDELPLREQATIFRNAKVAAGYIGSGLYSAMFSATAMDPVEFVNSSCVATNEFIVHQVRGSPDARLLVRGYCGQ